MYLNKYIKENGKETDYPVFCGCDHTDIYLPTNDLFLSQYIGNEYNAVDIIVKYLAIENYYGINNYGFDLYNKMQQARINEKWDDRFKSLIKSIEQSYKDDSFIETDLNYSIHDGAHRTALALFHNVKNIPIRLFNTFLYRRDYSLPWFISNNFSDEELSLINNKLNDLLDYNSTQYYCILWTPARFLFEKIENEISNMQDIQILSSTNLRIKKDEFKKFIYDIYHTDDIKQERLDMKYNAIMNSLQKDKYSDDSYLIRILKIKIKYPDFRVKPLTGLPQSKKTMEVKKDIRREYQKYITDYYHDIMIHMTDNSKQNDDVEKILQYSIEKGNLL